MAVMTILGWTDKLFDPYGWHKQDGGWEEASNKQRYPSSISLKEEKLVYDTLHTLSHIWR